MTEIESKRFPFISLEKSINRAKQLYDADQRANEMSNAGAFAVWGYSDKSSGGFQTVAALRGYGLLEGTDTARIKLSKAAFDYFRDEREDVRAKALQAFALAPPLFKLLFSHWQGQPPADTLARSYLKIDRGFNEQSARSLLSIYKENLAYANLKAGDKVAGVDVGKGTEHQVDPDPIRVGDFVQWTSQGVDQFRQPRQVTAASDGYLQVHGSPSRIPMSEATVAPPVTQKPLKAPAAPVEENSVYRTGPQNGENDISVLLRGKRLEITADVDAVGLQTLTEMIAKYQEILKLLN